MNFPEKIIEKTIPWPCVEGIAEITLNVFKIIGEISSVFSDALEIVNQRFDLPCGRLCLEGNFDAFSIKVQITKNTTSTPANVDVLVTIELLRPLKKPEGGTINCLNPVMRDPRFLREILNTVETQYENACKNVT